MGQNKPADVHGKSHRQVHPVWRVLKYSEIMSQMDSARQETSRVCDTSAWLHLLHLTTHGLPCQNGWAGIHFDVSATKRAMSNQEPACSATYGPCTLAYGSITENSLSHIARHASSPVTLDATLAAQHSMTQHSQSVKFGWQV